MSGPNVLTAAEQHQKETDHIRQQLEGQIAEQQALKDKNEMEALASLKVPEVKSHKTEVLIKHIGAETKKDPQIVANILRTWLTEK